MQGPQGNFVWVVDGESKAQFRPVTVGPLNGDLWLIAEGLQTGERIVVDGGLKLAPGVPVKPVEPGPAPAADPAGRGHGLTRSTATVISDFCIRRPIFASVLSIVVTLAGLAALFGLPIEQYPPIAPPTVTVSASFPGADAQTVAQAVAAPIETQVNGVDNMLYMSSIEFLHRPDDADGLLPDRHRSGHRAGPGAEPRQHRAAAAAGHRAQHGRAGGEALVEHHDAARRLRARRPLRRGLRRELREPLRARRR